MINAKQLQHTGMMEGCQESGEGYPCSGHCPLLHLRQTDGEPAGLPVEKREFHALKHAIATHLLDAGADLAFVEE